MLIFDARLWLRRGCVRRELPPRIPPDLRSRYWHSRDQGAEIVEEGNSGGGSLVRTGRVWAKAEWGIDRRLVTLLALYRGWFPQMPFYGTQERSRNIVNECQRNCTINGACFSQSRSFRPQICTVKCQ